MTALLNVEVPATGTGPYCLFIHGFLSSRAQWRLNLTALEQVCRPVVVELWGHGRSPRPERPQAYSMEEYIRQFEAIRQRLGIADWLVCGQSMGACLALHYSARHPERVRATIFTNSMAAFLRAEQLQTPDTQHLIQVLASGGPQARAALDALPMHVRHARRLPASGREEMLMDAELLEPGAIAQTLRTLMPQLSVLGRLTDLRGPLLLVNGRYESKFQPIRDLAAQSLPQLEVVDLDGGHAVNAECADGFNAAASAFIQRHTGN